MRPVYFVPSFIFLKSLHVFHQDLCSINMYDAGVALSGFSCFITPDLARDLANDVMSLVCMTHYAGLKIQAKLQTVSSQKII